MRNLRNSIFEGTEYENRISKKEYDEIQDKFKLEAILAKKKGVM